jgi:SAM-dependent methyltransferase
MTNGYQAFEQAKQYLDFLETEDGKQQKAVTLRCLLPHLPENPEAKILDLGSGPGWLTFELSKKYPAMQGVDAAEAQTRLAQKLYPNINFQTADPQTGLPFESETFDCIVASLVMHDIEDQAKALKEIARVLKPGGIFLNLIINPYYAYPVGVWKRGLLGRLLGQKPKLKLRPYFNLGRSESRHFTWQGNLPCHFYPLSLQINNLVNAGLSLTYLEDVASLKDDKTFSLYYKLFRFPVYLLLKAKKL